MSNDFNDELNQHGNAGYVTNEPASGTFDVNKFSGSSVPDRNAVSLANGGGVLRGVQAPGVKQSPVNGQAAKPVEDPSGLLDQFGGTGDAASAGHANTTLDNHSVPIPSSFKSPNAGAVASHGPVGNLAGKPEPGVLTGQTPAYQNGGQYASSTSDGGIQGSSSIDNGGQAGLTTSSSEVGF